MEVNDNCYRHHDTRAELGPEAAGRLTEISRILDLRSCCSEVVQLPCRTLFSALLRMLSGRASPVPNSLKAVVKPCVCGRIHSVCRTRSFTSHRGYVQPLEEDCSKNFADLHILGFACPTVCGIAQCLFEELASSLSGTSAGSPRAQRGLREALCLQCSFELMGQLCGGCQPASDACVFPLCHR